MNTISTALSVIDVLPSAPLSGRDRAILAAVADGRCSVGVGAGAPLLIDGRCCSDQFAGSRLRATGLIRLVKLSGEHHGTAVLTPAGRQALGSMSAPRPVEAAA